MTHLHHEVPAAAERDRQAEALIGWLAVAPDVDAQIVVGDFNADPRSRRTPGCRGGVPVGPSRGERREPDVTWPSGLQAPAMDTDGDPDCLDYIWVRGTVTVDDCRLVFDRPAVDDPTLYPSDHLGLAAHLRVG